MNGSCFAVLKVGDKTSFSGGLTNRSDYEQRLPFASPKQTTSDFQGKSSPHVHKVLHSLAGEYVDKSQKETEIV